MKKLLLMTVIAFFGFTVGAQDSSSADSGGFNLGINVGLPVGDAGDGWNFNVTLDLSYLWEVSDVFGAGIATGYSHSFGDSVDLGGFGSFEVEDAGFIPIAGAARFNVSDEFILGADLGYAIGVSPSGNDGGFYYVPRIQYGVSESIDIVLAYRGTSVDGGSFDVLTLGVEFGL
jgi:hypothetical protein